MNIKTFIDQEVYVNLTAFFLSALKHDHDLEMSSYNAIDYQATLDNAGWDLTGGLATSPNFKTVPYKNIEDAYVKIKELYRDSDLELCYYEPLEFWVVSSRFKNMCIEHDLGELFVESYDVCIWCRCESGQLLEEDAIFKSISNILKS